MKLINGFTLAEVLITLGIIGIVASMTLPSITANYQNKHRSAAIKKFYSSIQQALLLSEIDNGPMEYWEKNAGDIHNEDGEYDHTNNSKSSEAFFNKYLKNYFKYIKAGTKTLNPNERLDFKIWLADGSTVYMHNGSCNDFILDVNGDKRPNKHGYDRFTFLLCSGNNIADATTKIMCGTKKFCAYNADISIYNTREKILTLCKTSPQNCTYLLQLDNWEFKKDYPFKL